MMHFEDFERKWWWLLLVGAFLLYSFALLLMAGSFLFTLNLDRGQVLGKPDSDGILVATTLLALFFVAGTVAAMHFFWRRASWLVYGAFLALAIFRLVRLIPYMDVI